VERRAGLCQGCDREFETGDRVTSALYSLEEGFARRDWCEGCFTGPEGDPAPFSWWAAEVPEPEKKKAVFDLGVARDFLSRLLLENAPERASLRYLLTLLLMRKRGVKLLEQFADPRGEIMVVKVPPSETEHEIVCDPIDEAEAESLRAELDRLFDLS